MSVSDPPSPRPENRSSDPLLEPGSFIDASSNVETLKPPNTDGAPAAESRSQRRRAPATVSSERPDWLPLGWIVEDRVRTSGATAGSVDKYYVGPGIERRFRSKKEVMTYLETGSVRSKKKMPENSEADAKPSASPASKKKKKSSAKVKKTPVNFDFHNVPEKIKWVLADSVEGIWTPFAGKAKVSESTKQDWAATFTSLTDKTATNILF